MIPVEFPVEAFSSLWQIVCCSATVIAAAFTFLFAPR
jgi:hypothetical protein